MAIVKMKRLRVMAMAAGRETLLRKLLRLGCVEISEPDGRLADPAWAALLERDTSRLAEARNKLAEANAALEALKRYGDVKDGMFVPRRSVSKDEFLSDEAMKWPGEVSATINAVLRDITRFQGEEGRLLSRRAALEPWVSLDMPLELSETAHACFRMGVLPGAADTNGIRNELSAADTAAELFEISADKQQRCCLLVAHKADEEAALEILRPHGFSVTAFQGLTGTASQNIAALDQALAETRRKWKEAEESIAAVSGEWETLRIYSDRLTTETEAHQNTERLLTDGTIVFFEGWCPAGKLQAVEALLEKEGCAWEASDPAEDEMPDVPVQLKNNWFTKPLNMVTDMYSLPAYGTVDPNPLMAPFFILFYGMMMADMGYGLIMMIAALVVIKKAKPDGATMRYMMPLLGLCGVSTFLWGAATGGFFGDLIPQMIKIVNPDLYTAPPPLFAELQADGTLKFALPKLFDPLTKAVNVLVGALVLGVAQIFTGMAVSMYKQIKAGETMAALCNEGAWYLVFILAGVAAVSGQITPCVIAILAVLVLTQGYGKKGVVGKLMGIFGSLYNNVTGYFSDILSYSRLMALMLAGAVTAQVFNTLGAMTGNVVFFFIIALVGNALNFALNILGCFVHDMRLQCLEYFGRFYEDGGKPFRPLDMDTKYYKVVK